MDFFRLTFNRNCFFLAIFWFLVEVAIARYIHDQFIRPFIGDVLVIVLLFYIAKTFLALRDRMLVIGAVLFAYAIETGQYFHLVSLLGLEHYRLARIVIGSTFDVMDLLAYTLGGALILLVRRFRATDH
ncbi:DUF2809 domain-containing protein [Pokkaliibacter plantistimulans]|uniref:DUF2809 domain-containing protein n=1 Tax=Proteobacteria bacterium 228 TaxID=2083153 RepID=A0A2S5KUZ5_9PROT|nr:DUF2809 domain-containing protein [Pokkaliibacter plantistimulans]PPC78677.1 DUF2809 domain-containing protein [Pokkaliibacter plantistimulans]